MASVLILVFIAGYLLIALEHKVHINKAASALFIGVVCWLILLFGASTMPAGASLAEHTGLSGSVIHTALFEHLAEIAEILFFLLGAMTIVEIIDAHHGFRLITDRIHTGNKVKLLWMISWITFFLSAGLDNLTTAIVMCALLRRLLKKEEDLWLFGGFVIIAANAGGAWSPIGDVTTIMLWIGGQVTTMNIIQSTFLASLVSNLFPLIIATFFIKKDSSEMKVQSTEEVMHSSSFERNLVFVIGILSLLMVPVFKSVTHMPPYMGILLAVGIIWMVTDLMHRNKKPEVRRGFSVAYILQKIDTPTILFFLGILLAVASLNVSGHLKGMALWLETHVGNIYLINGIIGIISSIVDNVPLVAACMGMYDLTTFPPDHDFWELLAYCAGTGGSLLIIGSAAGVATMGILKMNFHWYFTKMSLYALCGYLAGIGAYYLQHHI